MGWLRRLWLRLMALFDEDYVLAANHRMTAVLEGIAEGVRSLDLDRVPVGRLEDLGR